MEDKDFQYFPFIVYLFIFKYVINIFEVCYIKNFDFNIASVTTLSFIYNKKFEYILNHI